MKELFISVVSAVIITMLVLIVRRCIQLLTVFLNKKKAESAAAGKMAMEKAYNLAIMVLDSIAEITVGQIEATKASSIRKAVKAGQKEFTELTKLSDEAYESIVSQLGPVVYQGLEGCVCNMEELIRNKIEEVLPRVKASYSILDSGVDDVYIGNVDAEEDLNEGAKKN